jgi:GT2 family glycosyltransferase/glycosyltransferase involved in cell wall biosynthesis
MNAKGDAAASAPSASTGLLVLGMHRSGTSALARLLALGGANVGLRVSGAGEGNPTGHWEDAFAVEVHELLLAKLGARWDEPFSLPVDWLNSEAASEARAAITGYLAVDRQAHRLWAVKDPRLSLFARLWRQCAEAAGIGLASVVVVRHPLEVAQSLAARDGMGIGRALLLWLDYTSAAITAAEGMPTAVVAYPDLLADWRGAMSNVSRVSGGPAGLRFGKEAAREVAQFLSADLKHHEHDEGSAGIPSVIEKAWTLIVACCERGTIEHGDSSEFGRLVAPLREVLHPLMDEWRVEKNALWNRIVRVEATEQPVLGALPGEFEELRRRVDEHHAHLVEVFSADIRRMQATSATAMQAEAEARAGAEIARGLAPRVLELSSGIDALSKQLAASDTAISVGMDTLFTSVREQIEKAFSDPTLSVHANLQEVAGQADAGARVVAERVEQAVREASDQLASNLARASDALHEALGAAREVLEAGLAQAKLAGDLQGVQSLEASEILHGVVRRLEELSTQSTQESIAGLAALSAESESRRLALLDSGDSFRGALANSEAAIRAALVDATGQADERRRENLETLLAATRESEERGRTGLSVLSDLVRNGLKSLETGMAELHRARELELDLDVARVELATTRGDLAQVHEALATARSVSAATAAEAACAAEAADTAQRKLDEADAERRAELEARNNAEAALKARIKLLQGELGAMQAEGDRQRLVIRALREELGTLARVLSSRSWRWTRPIRALSRLLQWRWGEHDTAALRAAFGLRAAPGPATPSLSSAQALVQADQSPPPVPPVSLATPIDGLADVFVWAVIDWDFRFQRPQHLAKSLAQRGHRVFYISNNFVDSTTPGFRADPIDGTGRLFQVNLHLVGAPAIYFGLPSDTEVEALRSSLAALLGWTGSAASMSLVQHPYWSPLVRAVPNARVIYDCMDHHAGFENNASSVLSAESRLLRDSDLVIVTSLWLEEEVGKDTRACALVRNACEYEFFHQAPAEVFRDPEGRQVIGYYGAIAEWFDLDLVRAIALAHRDALVLLVGSDTVGAGKALADLPNVKMIGEVRYDTLPYWLHGFDVALLPFRVIPLTLATNPVKVYEYLAAGKPVVVVDVPEMAQFEGLVRIGSTHEEFVEHVSAALSGDFPPDERAARQQFAAGQTWDHRARAIDEAIASIVEPPISVVVLTYNNLAYTQACLFSIEAYSDYSNLEVIVVDNASSDGSKEWLHTWADEPSAAGHVRKLVLNERNLGFSAGNNVGLALARGEVLILLNNDTYVTRGWVRTLAAHFRRDPLLGLVGPVTNNIGNEAKLEIEYSDIVEMHRLAGRYTRAHPGETLEMHNAAFFCVAIPRPVYELIGGLDEDFGVGFFEDDDYCRRVQAAGLRIACAEDVFVHHHLSASFSALGSEVKRDLFERNKAIYEAKWGRWKPHEYRPRRGSAA